MSKMTNMSKNLMEHRILGYKVLAVAVKDGISQWVAYISAIEGKDFLAARESVVKLGTKLDREVAEAIFPHWKTLKWRY